MVRRIHRTGERSRALIFPGTDIAYPQCESNPKDSLEMVTLTQVARFLLPQLALDTVAYARLYKDSHGVFPNIVSPKNFTEKVLWRSLFDRRPILRRFADKCAARDFVKDRLGADILPNLYHLTENPDTIPFDDLPDRFVVKPTHGSGWIKLVPHKAELDISALKDQCRSWLSQDFYEKCRERVYRGLPRRIIVEEMIDDKTQGGPADYKFFVFHGRVKVIQAIFGRHAEFSIYHLDREWRNLNFNFNYEPFFGEAPHPPHLAEMIEVSEILAKDIDFVRVDLYDTPEKIFFGELTTTPSAGLDRFNPKSFDDYLGSLW